VRDTKFGDEHSAKQRKVAPFQTGDALRVAQANEKSWPLFRMLVPQRGEVENFDNGAMGLARRDATGVALCRLQKSPRLAQGALVLLAKKGTYRLTVMLV